MTSQNMIEEFQRMLKPLEVSYIERSEIVSMIFSSRLDEDSLFIVNNSFFPAIIPNKRFDFIQRTNMDRNSFMIMNSEPKNFIASELERSGNKENVNKIFCLLEDSAEIQFLNNLLFFKNTISHIKLYYSTYF